MDIKVNGVTLHYKNIGQGQPMLLLHGNGETHHIFDKLTEKLAKAYTVYAIDSRGHGESSKVRHLSYHDMAEDIAGVIEQLGIAKPCLYGFSDGGIIGLLLASKYPHLLSKLIISGANTNPHAIKTFWRYFIRISSFFVKNPRIRLMLSEPHITQEDLNKITIPVLVLAGQRDMIYLEDTRLIAENIANSTLTILEKETHSSYVYNNDKLLSAIKEFIGFIPR
ncbi:MAG: alpha/beta hydrolase [Peptococcaceae bacterium]|nr:alpha/beta hydrolase [Peptococcaceae bacterium]